MKNAMTRRELFSLLGLSLLLPAGKVRAAPRSRVVDVERGKYGTTITMELVHAPYPFKGKPYKDATTIAYVPHHYRLPASRKIDCVVHFHGHGTNARRAMKDDSRAAKDEHRAQIASQGRTSRH